MVYMRISAVLSSQEATKRCIPVKDDWDQLQKNWKTIPSDKSPVVGVPNIKDGILKPTISEILDVIDYEHMEDGEDQKSTV